MGCGPGSWIIIVLDNGNFHRTTQLGDGITDTLINIADALPSPAGSGNTVYAKILPPTKLSRIWDYYTGSILISTSLTWRIISSPPTPDNDYLTIHPERGQWNLMELEMHLPTLEADKNNAYMKFWVNGELSVDVFANIGSLSGTYPFQGFQPRLIGNDTSRPLEWAMPNNFIRLAQVYKDRTPQRIIVCDSNVSIGASNIQEICLATEWSDTQIKFKLNQGEHASFSGLYIWHVNASNSGTLIGKIV